MRHAKMDRSQARPRVLGVRFGVNPNSSSLGINVSYLVFGGAAALLVGLLLSVWLRGRKRLVQEVGTAEPAPRNPAS